MTSAPNPPSTPTRLQVKLLKWRLFTLSIAGILIAIDAISATIGPSGEENILLAIFGGGGLFAASIGLTVAAIGDMLCDHFPNSPPLEHFKYIFACFALTIFAIVLYVLTKENLDLSSLLVLTEHAATGRPDYQIDVIEARIRETRDTRIWVALASPIYCTTSAYVSFQTIKRSEPQP